MDTLSAARALGFYMARQTNIDFSRAELYAVLFSAKKNKLMREFAHAFFLGSGALLSGWSNKSISNLSTNPSAIRVFQGFIDYGYRKPPVRMRLVWDGNGTLVNSWISVSLKDAVSTPMSGTVICQDSFICSIRSDDSGFAQVWSTNSDKKAEYEAQMPFSGLRYFEVNIDGDKAAGKIWDPVVDQIGEIKDLKFKLMETKDGVF